VAIINVLIFLLLICFGSPIFVVNKLSAKFSPERNRTIIGIEVDANKESVETIYFAINNFFLPFTAFIIIIVCTTILVVSLKKRTKLRKQTMANNQEDITKKNQKVARMVVMISSLFIFCFVPIGIAYLTISIEREMYYGGKLFNIGNVMGGIGILFVTVNSSCNIFLYYYMSTKFRHVFRSIFCSKEEPKSE
jgi:hypothetical protein